MLQIALGIAIGFHSLYWLSFLPPYWWYMTAIIVSLVIFYYCKNHFLFWFSISAFLAVLCAEQYLKKVEDIPLNRTNLIINVRISAVINENIPISNIEVEVVDNYFHSSPDIPVLNSSHKLLLIWPDAPTLKQGQIWRLPVKLSRIVGRVNQAGFDAEQYAVSRNIHGKAVVRHRLSSLPLLLPSRITWRQLFYDKALSYVENMPNKAYLLALAFGDRSGLTKVDWLHLRDSGTAHLLAISGLHIALAMLLGWQIGRKCKLFLPQKSYFIWLPMLTGLCIAFSYAWLSSFTTPTIRALIMCLFLGILKTTGVYWRHWQLLLAALALSLFIEPFTIYSASFWLSFYAVGVLILFTLGQRYFAGAKGGDNRFSNKSIKTSLLQLLKIQIWLLVLMLPIQWLWFGGVSLVAPIANAVAVPIVSIVTVPLVLLALITLWFPPVSSLLWQCADWSLIPIIEGIQWLEGAWYPLSVNLTPLLWGAIVIFVALILLPLSSFKWLYSSVVVITLCWLIKEPEKPHWKMLVLDVGHGLAVLIIKNDKAVLYDTGNRWEDRAVAETTILPILAQLGIKKLDYLIISHDDSDHAGGKTIIIEKLSPQYKYSSNFEKGYLPCQKDQKWYWQGLTFTVQWPLQRVYHARNPHSCVIHVQASNLQGPSVLLTGDIDAIAELMMLKNVPTLDADILLVPHHGSKTSSTHTFIDTINPSLAIVSTSFYNTWNLPAKSIKARYQKRGIEWLSTGKSGQVSVTINDQNYQVITERKRPATQWYRPNWL
ncbi:MULTISPECIES: DNA internalization-related competence protein ComEC/Rec2 [unclassified Photobacterium]|uniref:DNA internalization-related competence protein ComEC/Rec2 n=1 Tax=unclassified Photobacterium TaxID=2628852 RepID=UPI001EE0C92D|nr:MULTISPECIES: DNA internalization-related competence protein ComEC/Rec2 [unclassified Photobacterium]MCG3866163.1 DNA internalization-related competence protein ComEC/Rec2 [Photobacterium sp. Ph6]MCG3877692.1 DNA internalization-related competence protein ComEC/Rec2 [Photobacterium sp. Ph5]